MQLWWICDDEIRMFCCSGLRESKWSVLLCFFPFWALNSAVRMRSGIWSGYEHRVHHWHHQWDTARRLTNVTVAADRSSINGARLSVMPTGRLWNMLFSSRWKRTSMMSKRKTCLIISSPSNTVSVAFWLFLWVEWQEGLLMVWLMHFMSDFHPRKLWSSTCSILLGWKSLKNSLLQCMHPQCCFIW
jgi:hypothetical protein